MLQVHMPVLEPSTLLQLALFKETGPRGTRKSVMAGLLRLRLNSLTSGVDHSAELPMCASRKQGGEKTATLGLNIKVCFRRPPHDHHCSHLLRMLHSHKLSCVQEGPYASDDHDAISASANICGGHCEQSQKQDER